MSVSRRDVLITGAVSVPVSGLWAAVAGAQQPRPAGQPGGQPATGSVGQDPLLAACLLIGGKKQIEKCEYSMKKLRMDETKAFAKAEIDEHVTIKKKLNDLGYDLPAAALRPGGAPGGAPPAPPGGAVPPGAAAAQPPAAGQPPRPGGGPGMMIGKFPLPPGAAELLMVDLEVAEQCVQNYRKEMDQKEGVKFEKAFVGDQLHEHFGLLDRVQVFQRHASDKMKPVLAEGQGVIEKHIATLKGLMEKLDNMQDKK